MCGTLWIVAVVTVAEASAEGGAEMGVATVGAGAGGESAVGLTDTMVVSVLWAENRIEKTDMN